MRPLLAFVAILKNEVENIRRTLESVKPFVDQWTVLDTGSVDGTQDLVRDVMAGVPGVLFQEPFVDFATSRNRVLKLHESGDQSAEFTLMLSGDETLEGGAALREFLEAKRGEAEFGAYCVDVWSGDVAHWLFPRVLRTDARWQYYGDVHEVPLSPDLQQSSGPTILGVRVVHRASDPERKFRRLREYDLPRLTRRAAAVDYSLEERAQSIWFLGQTHEALAEEHEPGIPGGMWLEHKLMAMALYRKRAELGDDQLKSSYAYLCSLKVADTIGFIYTHQEILQRLQIVVGMNPKLPEAHYMIALHEAHLDARRGLFLAEKAAEIAREATAAAASGDQTLYMPLDSRVEWVALGLAADCARILKREDKARKLAEQAVAAGAPRHKFEDFLR